DLRRHRPGRGRPGHGAGIHRRRAAVAALVAAAAGDRRGHPRGVRPVHADRLVQAAPAQPGSDPGCHGWAVNAKAGISIGFGAVLTQLAHLPAGAARSLHDPYARRRVWPWLLALVVMAGLAWAAYHFGWLAELRAAVPQA